MHPEMQFDGLSPNVSVLTCKPSYRASIVWTNWDEHELAHLSLQDSFTVLIIFKYLLVEFKHFGVVTTGFQVHRLQEQQV